MPPTPVKLMLCKQARSLHGWLARDLDTDDPQMPKASQKSLVMRAFPRQAFNIDDEVTVAEGFEHPESLYVAIKMAAHRLGTSAWQLTLKTQRFEGHFTETRRGRIDQADISNTVVLFLCKKYRSFFPPNRSNGTYV